MMDQGYTYNVAEMFPASKLGRFDDGPVRKTSFFNANVNPITTQNRELIAHPRLPTGLTELKDDIFIWIDPTQGNSKDSHKMYGFCQSQIPRLGRIDTVRIDVINPDANGVDAEERMQLATALTAELNAASDIHAKRWKPKNYDVIDVLYNPVHRYFFIEFRKWQVMTKEKFRLGGLNKYSPVAKQNLGTILNSNPVLHNGDFTNHLLGKLDAENVWYYETGVQPRLENHLGFMIHFAFSANSEEPGIIDVTPHFLPVFCEDDEKRLEVIDYYCGTCSFNQNTNKEHFDATGPKSTIQINLNIT